MSGIALCDITVTVDNRTIVSSVGLVASPGEVTGIVGPNGAGKSTLLRTIYRHLAPSAGLVLVGADNVWELPTREAARRVAAVPQEAPGAFDTTVREAVTLGRVPHLVGFARETPTDRDAIDAALAETDLCDLADRSVATLSGGERQRVWLARAFAQDGDVLVLDEPTNHLDLAHQARVLRLIRSHGTTAIITLHDLSLAAAVCDRLHVVHNGRLVASGTPAQVITPALLGDVFGVHATVVTHPSTGRPLVAVDHLRAQAPQRPGST